MKIEQLYTGCLAQGAYYLESNGEAAIIDPLREIQQYLDLANSRNAKIKYIFETHFHADFVSGHVDLAKATGAPVIFGPTKMATGYEIQSGHDGQVYQLGAVSLTLLHTPGHTMESSCYLLKDASGKETALFSGDTLFIGDVGRPDLAQHVISDLTEEKLAGHLYESLRKKILPLSDDLIVYPAHGAGSACGKNLSKETYDTLGNQKKVNFYLNPSLSKEEFVQELLSGLTQPPAYFPKNVLMNIQGYASVDSVIRKGMTALNPDQFISVQEQTSALIIDTRKAADFGAGFIPGSINIALDGSYAVWVGTLVKKIDQPLLLVTDPGREEEAITRLARVGYDHTQGYLSGGLEAWKAAGYQVDTIQSVSADELATRIQENPQTPILDVRKKSEFDSEHVVQAINVPLDYIETNSGGIDPAQTYYVHCAGGYRSMVFVSLMRKKGLTNLINVEGGFAAIKQTGQFDVTAYVCPTTML